ncbi:MAG: hypothetical protein A2504_10220 [Bdellovibrionales bacterium RIFOXYD12_FULL_39_22]|nr:MAG: hypothetical protein A2385_15025 [Bdellovibrionales bacterium RIFOXYB1_FULL_39_21]OFZ46176.1 MAG: hypothetical protein A2404_01160 [Bdellovibrionales bacterium RIFOXYC1_FULL_39_130]OFZ74685.1 MAG: hypothetical protein A2560_10690 [Bdellovibrionales bacterium RIFOXYD1_FULL_39_84]OFZ94501.1 MAG: hypothetical protein A2504_10220 [Bdellovibrionales bacterium RIFOXYD12_FULL_39_22]
MEYNEDKVDELLLALMFLTTFPNGKNLGTSTWKEYDWHHLDRLHEKGYISNPKSKNKTVRLSEEAIVLSKELFKKHFGIL